MLSEISQAQKDNILKVVKVIQRQKVKQWFPETGGKEGIFLFNGYRVSFYKMKRVTEMDGDMVVHYECTNATELHI